MGETEGGFYESGVAHIKKEYLLPPKVAVVDAPKAEDLVSKKKDLDFDPDFAQKTLLDVESAPKKARLASNHRNNKAVQQAVRFCRSLGLSLPCEYGETCRHSHDMAAFMAMKGPSLGTECPNVKEAGWCKYGLQCRFSEGHPEVNKEPTGVAAVLDKMAVRTDDLRKRRIEFPRSEVYIKTLDRNNNAEATRESYAFGERKKIDFEGKLYLAPLTTVGNLPFRRICKEYGVDITCGEMAMATNLLKGQMGEWALLKRHASEDVFGVQICGAYADTMTRCAELIDDQVDCDFIDVNMGCPIDIVYQKGMGSGLMERPGRMQQIVQGMAQVMRNKGLTVKMRIGVADGRQLAHKLIPRVAEWGASAVTVHGRTRQQRYTREADWSYISQCVDTAQAIQVDARPSIIGNGDILSWEEYEANKKLAGTSAVMVARGALVKPWIFTEIKEQRNWDISSSERFAMLQRYTSHALDHFGTDTSGVEKTRMFLLEWLGFLHRYIPVGLLERVPQRINERPQAYYGRDEMETLMASDQAQDWITISERLLGKAPEGFKFNPKHKSNSYGVNASERQCRATQQQVDVLTAVASNHDATLVAPS